MSLKSLLLLTLSLSASALGGQADTPVDYFHNGATNYIFGEKQKAKAAVESGLRMDPTNQMLLKLDALLKEEEQQQQQSKDDKQDESKKDQQSKQDQKDKNQQQEQKKSEQEKSKEEQNQEKKKQEEQEQQKQDASKKDDKQGESKKGQESKEQKPDNPEDQQAQAQKAMIGRMTPKEAQQLLDAQKTDEKAMIFIPKVKPNRPDRVLKDW